MPYHEVQTHFEPWLPESPTPGGSGSVLALTEEEPEEDLEKRPLGFGHAYKVKRRRKKR